MATGDTAQPLALSSSPPPLLDHSPSNLSSPLSDVEDEDKDAADELGMALHAIGSAHTDQHKKEGNSREEEDGASGSDSDELSEADINDSEAETERLYDTPPKNNGTRDIVMNGANVTRNQQFTDRRDRIFERSPSKLQQQIQPETDADHEASDDELSEADQEDNDDVSLPLSDGDAQPDNGAAARSPSPVKKALGDPPAKGSTVANEARQPSVDSRKRKRSSAADNSDSDQPLRKRTGSVVAPDNDFSADETAVIDDEGISTNPQSGEHSGDEDQRDAPEPTPKDKEVPAESIEEEVAEPVRPKKSKRSSAKKRKSKSPDDGDGGGEEETPRGTNENAEGTSVDNTARPAEDDLLEVDPDEEAEAAHREEELERKKAAWEELTAIEKQFSSFRERLYQERLDQLNREEAMLTGPNPTHPEYLAMLKCLDERRDEKIRLSGIELQFKMEVLKNRAVAERGQMLGQFYQSVRDSRERVLEALGQDWYAIQYERRRQANNIPDYGIRFPSQKSLSIKNAVSYNKEVSILSGFAKHVGFPAAPGLSGASEEQLDQDLEAIYRARQAPIEPVPHYPAPAFHRELSASLPFGRIGPAGEQFIEQTPWANPNHPSHHIQRQTHDEANASSSVAGLSTASTHRRNSHQAGGIHHSTPALVNGDSPIHMQKSFSAAGHESMKPSKLAADNPVKRDTAMPAF